MGTALDVEVCEVFDGLACSLLDDVPGEQAASQDGRHFEVDDVRGGQFFASQPLASPISFASVVAERYYEE